MDWSSLIGPAVVAALIGLIGLWWSNRTTKGIQDQRLEADLRLAQYKTETEMALNLKRFNLELERKQQDLAEEVLSGFYQMRDVIRAVRSPMSWRGEAKERAPHPGENADEARLRDAYYAPNARLKEHRQTINDLLARKYRVAAWFGPEASAPFEGLRDIIMDIRIAADQLVEHVGDDTPPSDPGLREMIGTIWRGASKPDAIDARLDGVIGQIERITRPVLSQKPAPLPVVDIGVKAIGRRGGKG